MVSELLLLFRIMLSRRQTFFVVYFIRAHLRGASFGARLSGAYHRPIIVLVMARVRQNGESFLINSEISQGAGAEEARPCGCRKVDPLGPLGFECSQHRPTPRPSVERIRRKGLFQISRIQPSSAESSRV